VSWRVETSCHHVLVHTGQNYDHELNEVFFSDLGVRKPDHFLGVDTSSLGATVGGILVEIEKVLIEERPDAVLILGDTNSAIAAYIARRLKIPVYHMEAGNRCFDRNVPEETNRKLVDHILPARRIYVTGSPMREVLEHYKNDIDASQILGELSLKEQGYVLASLHREENVDDPQALRQLIEAMNGLAIHFDCPIVISTHPRTWLKPFGFHDYNRLQKSALCVLSDSGTIAEESSMLGFPAVTPRFSIERPEAMDTGAIIACGSQADDVLRTIEFLIPHNV